MGIDAAFSSDATLCRLTNVIANIAWR